MRAVYAPCQSLGHRQIQTFWPLTLENPKRNILEMQVSDICHFLDKWESQPHHRADNSCANIIFQEFAECRNKKAHCEMNP
jgi:hypothetical protein